ncbi:MAG: acyl carrier protein phosphodiesterase [Flavobacteriaceae bacterium]|nr:MAG: acyl carrier protein phosphodiesterase [Flavobacteriaceae bacterium]
MNFLAHIYLSFDDPQITLGNFMADSIRGRDYLRFPSRIQKGVLLHRAIDTFTDTHPITRISSKRLHSRYRHYSMVIVDIYYDHFLARNWDAYSDVSLESFTENFYTLLEDNLHLMPESIQRMSPYMITDNWLLNYREIDGIHRVLKGLNRRTGLKSGMDQAVEELTDFYGEFEAEFTAFFDELIIFSRQKLITL